MVKQQNHGVVTESEDSDMGLAEGGESEEEAR